MALEPRVVQIFQEQLAVADEKIHWRSIFVLEKFTRAKLVHQNFSAMIGGDTADQKEKWFFLLIPRYLSNGEDDTPGSNVGVQQLGFIWSGCLGKQIEGTPVNQIAPRLSLLQQSDFSQRRSPGFGHTYKSGAFTGWSIGAMNVGDGSRAISLACSYEFEIDYFGGPGNPAPLGWINDEEQNQ